MSSSVQYFEKWAMSDPVADPVEESIQLRQLYAEIDQLEQQLAERVAAGYAVVGPMLAAYEAGTPPDLATEAASETPVPQACATRQGQRSSGEQQTRA